MIPSDHFVRFYNEVFKYLDSLGRDHLLDYWREVGRHQAELLAEDFRKGGFKAAYDYWSVIAHEENCDMDLRLEEDYFELKMNKCPSLGKAMDNDAGACEIYCDHCMAWIQIVMEKAGLHPAYDIESRVEPHCNMRIYKDPEKARAREKELRIPARPYEEFGSK